MSQGKVGSEGPELCAQHQFHSKGIHRLSASSPSVVHELNSGKVGKVRNQRPACQTFLHPLIAAEGCYTRTDPLERGIFYVTLSILSKEFSPEKQCFIKRVVLVGFKRSGTLAGRSLFEILRKLTSWCRVTGRNTKKG